MKRGFLYFSWLFLSAIFISSAFGAEKFRSGHVEVSWLAPKNIGSTTTIAIRYKIDPEWHIYWKNPGDSGTAPKFDFSASKNALIGAIQWPFPKRLPVATLVNLGYEKETAFFFTVSPLKKSEAIHLDARLEWLVCREECTPGFATLTLDRPVVEGAADWDAQTLAKFSELQRRLPVAETEAPWKIASATLKNSQFAVKLAPRTAAGAQPDLFPLNGDFLTPQAPDVKKENSDYLFVFKIQPGLAPPAQTDFVLVEGEKSFHFDNVDVKADGSSAPAAEDGFSLWILLSAFVGGFLLNLMPCVLPVLSIKIFSFAKSGNHKREALLYSLGVLTTFALLGGVFLALRAAGSAIGWGFQLQSPMVVSAMILLFWLLGLNFFGFFEWGDRLMNWAGSSSLSGSFATGALSVFVAAPCTGPFMGTALGAAAMLSSVQAMGIFLSLALGLASPFLVLAVDADLLKKMPKPGAWMERFREFFAFPLFATALWLLWVLSVQLGASACFAIAALLLAITFSFWLGRSPHKLLRGLAWIMAFFSLVTSGVYLFKLEQAPPSGSVSSAEWAPFDKARLASALAQKQAVFVDFTAAWCITCQVNRRAVLETTAARELFQKSNVLLLEADWTKQDAAITRALAEFHRNSVPLYVFYPRDGTSPKILPQLLTTAIIKNILSD